MSDAIPALAAGRAPRVLFYVQHLLGIGHMKRAERLVQGLGEAGLDVWVVSGGEPVPGIRFPSAQLVQLPALRTADSGFSQLVDARGEPLDDAFKARRREQLLNTFFELQPDCLLLESYPFGRRQLRWELKPLLKAARQAPFAPLVLCSLRDILQARKPERVAETLQLVEAYVDGILVHGDPAFIPLEASFPQIDALADKVHYCGYVTGFSPAPEAAPLQAGGEVLVSAGGGAVGFDLLRTALLARPHCRLRDRTWRCLAGPNLPDAERRALQALAAPGVVVEGLRSDFRQRLATCALSISQAGYNTVMDLLVTGARGLLIPFEGEGETEQRLRTERLAATGQVGWLAEAELSPAALAQAIDRLLARPAAPPLAVNLAGVRGCAERVVALLAQRRARLTAERGGRGHE